MKKSLVKSARVKRMTFEIERICSSKGGSVRFDGFLNMHSKIAFKCSNGHSWMTTGASIKYRGSWCPECSGLINNNSELIHQTVTRKGGRVLSGTYTNQESDFTVACDEGHEFVCNWKSLRRGSWCPRCAGVKKITLQDTLDLAASRGGTLLSGGIRNAHVKLKWKCGFGHIFTASYNSVQQGAWCSSCHGSFEKNFLGTF
jgi:hypothetical protein